MTRYRLPPHPGTAASPPMLGTTTWVRRLSLTARQRPRQHKVRWDVRLLAENSCPLRMPGILESRQDEREGPEMRPARSVPAVWRWPHADVALLEFGRAAW